MSSSRLRIWACTDTSSADTGSSQMITFGSSTSDRAIEMRWHCPPENWWGRLSADTAGSRPTASSTSLTRAVCSASVPRFQMRSGSATMSFTLRRGFSDEIGSWKMNCSRVRTSRSCWPLSDGEVDALEEHLAAGRRRQLHDGAAGGGLAAAGLADEPERLALAHVEADAGHGVDDARLRS